MLTRFALPVVGVVVLVGLLLPQSKGDERRCGTGGTLQIVSADGVSAGVCPLKHTSVSSDIVGYVARTTVRQVFENPTDQKIEAIYTFPLPESAAVDDMVMVVGDRRVVGQIHERQEAQEIYEQARAVGHVASLLDQERPNIFTQSVANIEPGVEVAIEIRFVETLKCKDGWFEWTFPMVVGPRYIPGGGTAPAPMTTGTPTDEVPDADRITPPVTPEGTRSGHDIDLTVQIDAGMKIGAIESVLHGIEIAVGADRTRPDETALVSLTNEATIPNRDFILRYRVEREDVAEAFLVHEDARGKFFTLVLHPPERVVPEQLAARELIFVLDTSGSMGGFPIETAKKLMKEFVGTMRPADTFNIITFAGGTHILWDAPRPATEANITAAQGFLRTRRGGGGTEMMKAIDAALTATQERGPGAPLRVVCFMTDGYVGNDEAIVAAIRKNAAETRVFSFGIGNSVNRFLLESMAVAGRGECEIVTLEGQAADAAERFHERLLAPVLTDITIDWGTLPVADVVPELIPDLFSARPIMVHGRLTGPAAGTITLRGYRGDAVYEMPIDVDWPEAAPDHDALASLWARAQVDQLMMQDYAGVQAGEGDEGIKAQVIDLGLKYRLLTQYTSFVAVEEMTVTSGGEPVTIQVPVEMPEGVTYEGVFRGGGGGGAMFGVAAKSVATARRGRAMRAATAGTPAAAPVQERADSADWAGFEVTQGLGDAGEQVLAAAKLAPALREVVEQVEMLDEAGNGTIGALTIVGHQLDVMVMLSDLSEETRTALAELGFAVTGESRTIRMLTGTIDVRKLEALAGLDVVQAVRALPQHDRPVPDPSLDQGGE
jgi:Ca-activated chloride channel family protein